MSSSPTVCQSLELEPRDLMHHLLPSSKSLLSFPCPPKMPPKIDGYVHPLSKSFLSSKSLEMCTESLGCETGSGIDEFPHLASPYKEKKKNQHNPINKAKKQGSGGGGGGGGGGVSFPPPLTSISGSGGVQVHTHREGGRLVIKAVAFSVNCGFFQAERGNGRLRLSLLRGGGGEEGRGKVWSSSRCNGDESGGRKRLQSLPFCVVGV